MINISKMSNMAELCGRNVVVTSAALKRRIDANRKYLMKLDRDNLLLNHRMEAGLYSCSCLPKDIHGGWESPTCQVRGHFTGHWLSAAALCYFTTGDGEVKAKADYLVGQIALCQKENGGEWAAPIPEKYLSWLERKKQVWAPQYTVHKTFMGLLDMAQMAGNELALEVAENFAKWFARWTKGFSREQFDDILDVETGGMLEIWVQLYEITKKPVYLELTDKYYRGRLFDALLSGGDPLTNMHANTTIPEIIGCARAYEATGERRYRDIAEAYWDQAVTRRGYFATGGQTCGEIWTPKNEMNSRLGGKNQEFCTVYNMMRLAGYLLRWTGDAAFADYYERSLYNGVMAQTYWAGFHVNGEKSDYPDSGLLAYFLPMAPGSRKAWATETEDFFCCHGTMVQANAGLGRGIYYQDSENNSLYVCQYFDSDVSFHVNNNPVRLLQKRDTMTGGFELGGISTAWQDTYKTATEVAHNPDVHNAVFQVQTDKPAEMTVRLRVPSWAYKWKLTVNGEEIRPEVNNGFCAVRKTWQNRDRIRFEMSTRVESVPLPGDPSKVAFSYGPTLLAGIIDNETRLRARPGEAAHDLLTRFNEREWGNWTDTFITRGQAQNIRFAPIHDIGYERYTVYFPVEHY